MSFQPPAHWSPPAAYRPPRVVYPIAAALAVLLVAALALPVGIAVLRYRGDWPPAAARGGLPAALRARPRARRRHGERPSEP